MGHGPTHPLPNYFWNFFNFAKPLKRDVTKAGEGEDWKKKTRDRGGWNILSVAGSTSNTLTKGKEEVIESS